MHFNLSHFLSARRWTSTVIFHAVLLLCIVSLQPLAAQPKHEVRAVWLTTYGGIDWPRTYAQSEASAERQREELRHTLDQLQRANINTVLFQTRIRGTVVYPSQIEPWDAAMTGHAGRSPGYDPLLFAIEECHRRGMELHAWLVAIPMGKWDGAGCRNMRRTHPQLLRRLGADAALNPENSATAGYIASLCEEITRRYDVDGIHLDYIRYPDTWNISVSRQQGRQNITRIVSEVRRRVKALKPWVKLTCSPIGKHDDMGRYSSGGWNAYQRVCQDAQGWLRDGLMDGLFPMMYFDGRHFYPFVADWSECSYGRPIAAGLGTYRLARSEGDWSLSTIERQMNVARQHGLGICHFRSRFLTDDTKGVYQFTLLFNHQRALVPPMTWAGTEAPTPPTLLSVARTPSGNTLTWSGATDRSDGDYLTYNIYASPSLPVDTGDASLLAAQRVGAQTISLQPSATLHYAVTAVSRYGLESGGCQEQTSNQTNYVLPSWRK